MPALHQRDLAKNLGYIVFLFDAYADKSRRKTGKRENIMVNAVYILIARVHSANLIINFVYTSLPQKGLLIFKALGSFESWKL